MFKINDRVKIIVPENKDKAILQDNYFSGCKVSPIGKFGRISDTGFGDEWFGVKLDEPVNLHKENWLEMYFPEWELELVEETGN